MDNETCYRAILARDKRYDGRFFTAVLTTGIFCRPICPAKPPKLKNCRFMPSAAAATAAGFRPCLRCRPELSPNSPGWLGTSATVTKALRYISDGFLNDHTVPELAEKMGLGERHFRRLFQKHMGTSPKNVALTQRLLMAKQLLTETRLPVSEVAHAAGFQSLRRFNAALKKHFRLSPSDIRKQNGSPLNETRDKSTDLTLKMSYSGPYNWQNILNYLGPRAIPGVEHIHKGCYSRTFHLNGKVGSFTVAPQTTAPLLSVTLHTDDITAIPLILSRIRNLFDLDTNIAVVNDHLSQHAALKPSIENNPGHRLIGAWDPFELTVRAILGQQVSVAAATTLTGRLTTRHGLPSGLSCEGLKYIFPSPEILADADLSGLGITGNRMKAIQHLARTVADDPAFFQHPTNLPDFITHMCALPGIGPWTANYVAMRAMREADAFPSADLVLQKRLQKKNHKRPTAKELDVMSEDWRPWRAYAAMLLWASDT
ncbi:MAG: DNA-3-methyladenine glycosylase 2 family protein [Emcibacter sp.]|nr:DNA-3-methyladenine glycosylase 2 family protein [Emcibacter sp.]